MAIILICNVPVDGWKDRLVQRGYVEPSRPLDRPRDAAIRAKSRDRLGEAHKVAEPGVRSKTHEHVDVIG